MKKLAWYDLISINLFWLALNIRNNAVGNIFMPYLVALFVAGGVKNTALGEMNTAGLIIAMLVQPAAGLLSDRSLSRFGRRRPFILVGVLLDLLFLACIALSWNFGSLLAAVLLQQFSANISHGALQGLIPDLVPEKQHGMASAVKAVMELLPLILLAFTIAKWVGARQFDLAVIVTGATLLALMLLTMLLVKEEPLKERPTAPLAPTMLRVLGVLAGILLGGLAGLVGGGLVGGLVGLIAWPLVGPQAAMAVGIGVGGFVAMAVAVVAGVWAGALATLSQDARRQSSFTWWVVNRLMFFAAITSIQKFAPFFLMYVFNITIEEATSQYGSLIMVIGIFTLISALPGGWLSDRFGHKLLVGVSGIVGAVGTAVLLAAVWLPNWTVIYTAGCIVGLSAGLFTATNWALGTDLAPQAEAGRYLGISNLAGAGAGMIGTGIGGPVIDYLNRYQPGLGYFAIFSGYCILFILSTVSLRWVKQTTTSL
jgi:MFS family permease